jgi:hypothetical protein
MRLDDDDKRVDLTDQVLDIGLAAPSGTNLPSAAIKMNLGDNVEGASMKLTR